MLNIGFGELAIICIVLIIAVGPDRLPSMMKTLGKTMRTLRNASRDLRESTGIDELLRDDFYDYRPPVRRPQVPPKPPEPETVSRTEDVPAAAPGQAETASDAAPLVSGVTGETLVGVGTPPPPATPVTAPRISAPPPAGTGSQPPLPVSTPAGSVVGGTTKPGIPEPGPPPAAPESRSSPSSASASETERDSKSHGT